MSANMDQENKERSLAKEFVLYTNKNLFLTGKAGTGKTTLLKEILEETHKKNMVVAPTGVAAINAGGVTIHSLFLFPFQAFLPIPHSPANPDLYCDRTQLVKHHKYSREKRQLMIELELLIIDEISMVRADLLDAIDFTLRRVRRNSKPFGGIQLLVIGDLFQLAPVTRENIKAGLSQFYKSPFFFDALAWKQSNTLTIELNKVYRQEDPHFINILNNVRAGKAEERDLEILNDRYRSMFDNKDIITLTTHNKSADQINLKELSDLEGSIKSYEAKVSGKFPENAFPTQEKINLKVGAQVMFVRNHPEGLYFNGKIGRITSMDGQILKIKSKEDNQSLLVDPIEWTNSKYTVDPTTNEIVKEDMGSFVQYPLKLAWAVTVHKSQGLTFDKVVLDLANTFAPGQLYVALSRCRSLEGMILSSKITHRNVITDQRILQYIADNKLANNIEEILKIEKELYEDQQLIESFRMDKMYAYIDLWSNMVLDKELPNQADILSLINEAEAEIKYLDSVGLTFSHQLKTLIKAEADQTLMIKERASKAIDFYLPKIYEKLILPSENHKEEYKKKSKTSTYTQELEFVLDGFWEFLNGLYDLSYRKQSLYQSEVPKYNRDSTKRSVKKARIKGETYKQTLQMHQEGKSIKLIAKERDLSEGTIESHFSKLIKDELVDINDLMKESRIKKIAKTIEAYPDLAFSDLMTRMPMKVSYGELRWVRSYMELRS